jgi:hypothetical protein
MQTEVFIDSSWLDVFGDFIQQYATKHGSMVESGPQIVTLDRAGG